MPVSYEVHHDLRLIWARAHGVITAEDLFEYQRTAWGRSDVEGYQELVDMTAVTDIPAPSPAAIRALAALSASMDPASGSHKFAIVAPDDLAFGLGRMYQTHRALEGGSRKEVAVFRSVATALDWLGIKQPVK